MIKRIALSSTMALALAACGGNAGSGTDADADGDGEVSAEEAVAEQKKDGKDLKPQAGKYKVEMTLVSAEGMPPELQEAMKSGVTRTTEQCVTQEEADQGFGPPPEQLEEDSDGGCKVSKYDIEGNNIEMALACEKGPTGGTMEMSMTGTVSETKQDLTIVSKGMLGPEGSVTMNMKRERIGDCDA